MDIFYKFTESTLNGLIFIYNSRKKNWEKITLKKLRQPATYGWNVLTCLGQETILYLILLPPALIDQLYPSTDQTCQLYSEQQGLYNQHVRSVEQTKYLFVGPIYSLVFVSDFERVCQYKQGCNNRPCPLPQLCFSYEVKYLPTT